jgi:hypothetical protein
VGRNAILIPSGYHRGMIPMKHSTIFKSRWWALLWAAGIIWFALDMSGTGDSGSDNAASGELAPADANAVSGALGG